MKQNLLIIITLLAFISIKAQTFNSTLETSYGSNRADFLTDIERADNGTVVVSGYFHGTIDFDPGPGTFNLTSNGMPATNNTIWGANGFIQKFNASGNLDWAVANISGDINNVTTSTIQKVDVDPNGNIIVNTAAQEYTDIDPGPAILYPDTGNQYPGVGVIQKLDGTNGSLIWAKSIDAKFKMVVDQNGDVLIAGSYSDSVDLDPGPGTFWMDPQANNSSAPFAAKYSGVDGSFLWGADYDFAATGAAINDIDVDKNTGRLILCGWYQNQIWVNPDAPLGSHIIFTAPNQNYRQGFAIIVNSDGTHHSSRNYGHTSGNWSSETYSVAFDDLGYYYIGTSEPTSVSPFVTHRFRKYAPNHASIFSQEINMSDFSMQAKGNGEIYLEGRIASNGTQDIDPSATFFSPNHPNNSQVFMKWDASLGNNVSLDWYKSINEDFWNFNRIRFYMDVGDNDDLFIGATYNGSITPNISSTNTFTAIPCTPALSSCYDMYLNFGSVCSDTTFVNTNLNVCSGSNYTFSDGTTYNNITANFNHTAYTTSAGGCDSAVTYAVQAISHPTVKDTVYVCVGDSHTFHSGLTLQITGNATVNSFFTSSLGCDSLVQTYALGQTAPEMTATVSCNANEVTVTVTNMGTHQSNPSPPFDINVLDLNQTHTISSVGTYTFPISDNMLSGRIALFEPNNCAADIYYYNTCDQSICAGNDSSNLLNGDFENGTTNWTQFEAFLDSTNSGYLPINAQTFGNNRTFDYSTTSAWFGGWNQGSYNSISQNVVIATGGSATLEWWQRQEGGCAIDDVFRVYIDGNIVFEQFSDQDTHCGGTSPWNFKSVDVSAYADGMTHNVMFHYTQQGTNGYTSLFIDNIDLYTCPNPPVQMDLPVTFDDAMVYYATADFGGNASMFVNDPIGGTNQVVQTTKGNTAQTWAGTSLNAFTPSAFLNAVPFTATETVMSVRVYSPDAGIPVLLKVEDKTNGSISVETQTLTSVANAWETLHFDFNNHASGTPALNLANTYDLASIFFNFGTTGATAGTKTYYWDDVMMSPCTDTVFRYETFTVCYNDDVLLPDGTTYYNVTSGFNHNPWYFTTAEGCDSAVIYQVQAIQNPNAYDTVYVCSGDDILLLDGTTYYNVTSSFSHLIYFTAANGCDSPVIYQVEPILYPITYDTAYVCSGTNYTFPDGVTIQVNSDLTHTSNLISNSGCDSISRTDVFIETAPSISGEINCTANTVDVTVTDMGTYQGNVAPPFDISVEGTFYTIPGVGTYTYPITSNMLSLRIPVFEANNCAQDLWLYNTCEQSICPGNDTSNLLNGDFENATTTWTQFEALLDSSSSGYLPITTPGFNRTYNTSTTSAWFGGWNQGSYNSISQDVVIDAGTSATLEWWQRQENGCAADDVFTVLIDGDTVFELQADQDPHCGNTGGTTPWNFKSVDVSAYADGMLHNIMFHYTQQGTNGYTNLFIDNINLYTCLVPLVQMDLPVTFDDPTVLYATADFSGNSSMFVNDPIGGTNQVVQTTKNNMALTYAGTTLDAFTPEGFLNDVPFTATETVMSVRVYSPDAGIPVLLKVEDKTNGAISVETEVMTTLANTWETLYFDFNNNASGTPALNLSNTYDLATIFFNFGTDGATAGTKTYYWDDVQMDSIPCPTVTTSFNDTICFFDSYTFPDGNSFTWNQLPQDTTYETSFSTGNGCFGTAYTIVHKRPNSVGPVMFPNVCFGSNYTYPDGFTHTNIQSNLGHASVLTNQFGCDSNQLQILQVQPVYTFYDTTILCAGADYTAPDGTLYANVQTTFDHTSSLSTAYGCDSTHQSTVEVLPSYTLYTIDTICYNDSYTFPNGFTANNIQSFYHYWIPMTAQNGCDSTMFFDLYVRPNSQGINTNHTVCSGDDFTFADGVTATNINSNIVHLNTFTNQYGCDSTFIQFINTVNPVYNFTQNIVICYGTNYTALDGTFYGNIQADFSHTSSFTTQNGCDSSYLMTIQVAPDYTTNSSDTICYNDSYTFPDGNTLNNLQADTLYVIPFTTWQGACDSSVYVALHVRPNSQGVNTSHTVCSGDDFIYQDGTTEINVTSNTTHLNTFTNLYGCDSSFLQFLNINPVYNFNEIVDVCQGSDFTANDGTAYTNVQIAFSHTSNFTTQHSCDSTIITQVNVLPSYASTILDTICYDDSYTFPDGNTLNNLQSDTLYVISNTTQNGCDSLVSVNVNIRPQIAITNLSYSICSGGSFTYIDGTVSNNITTPENYTNTFTASNGCDSLVVENVDLIPSYLVQDSFDVCFGDDFTFADGTTLTISNDFTYTSNLTTAGSCDSIIETKIDVIGLGGTIQSSTALPLSNSKVYLIEHLPGQDYLFIQDSTTTNANGEYFFAEGDPNHYIKAIPSSSFPNDLATYFLNSPVYQYAVETDCNNSLDFTTIASQNLGGTGFISGFISDGAGKTDEFGNPLIDLSLVLVNANGTAIERTVTDENGYFIFENLTCGSYEIWLDDALTNNNLAPLISLEEICFIEDAEFVLDNNKLEIKTETSIENLIFENVSLIPNPTNGLVTINFDEKQENVEVDILDISGRLISNSTKKQTDSFKLNIDGSEGVYFVKLTIKERSKVLKVVLVK